VGALKVAGWRAGRRWPRAPARADAGQVASGVRGLPSWSWTLLWLGLVVAVALLVRLPGPATLDPDEHAAVLYFDRLVAGQRLEDPLLSSPKPLLTLVHGLARRVGHDWRLLEGLAVAAFALAMVCLARAAGRLAGRPAVGTVELLPLRTDPGRGLYVHRVRSAGGE
jgi:hypothetical protein